ncbi:MAG: hypothetical protein M1822_003761 [Bathelium mastoideum]|nr:MAG: hypothetical protein M1822_003761 [Bathelium mastoideum]
MHSPECSSEWCICPHPPSPGRRVPDPSIRLLRAKLAHHFFAEGKEGAPGVIIRDRCVDACPSRPWPASDNSLEHNLDRGEPEAQKHDVILNSISWKMEEVPTESMARKLANNPPIDCGAGYMLWVNDEQYREITTQNRRFINRQKKLLCDDFFFTILYQAVVREVKQFFQRRILKAELEEQMGVKLEKEGTLLYYKICHAVWKMNAEERKRSGTVAKRDLDWRARRIVLDSEDEDELEAQEVQETGSSAGTGAALKTVSRRVVIDLTKDD